MDWGKLAGKPHMLWENRWFPVDFPWNQSMEWRNMHETCNEKTQASHGITFFPSSSNLRASLLFGKMRYASQFSWPTIWGADLTWSIWRTVRFSLEASNGGGHEGASACDETVDGKNPAPVGCLSDLSHYRVSTIQGAAGFLPSTVWTGYPSSWPFWPMWPIQIQFLFHPWSSIIVIV